MIMHAETSSNIVFERPNPSSVIERPDLFTVIEHPNVSEGPTGKNGKSEKPQDDPRKQWSKGGGSSLVAMLQEKTLQTGTFAVKNGSYILTDVHDDMTFHHSVSRWS